MRASGCVGVDFGTATTFVAEGLATGAAILPVGRATPWLPSVARVEGRRIVVGEEADEVRPDQIRSIKRAITERRDTVTIVGPDGPQEIDVDRVIEAILAELRRRADAAFGAGREVRLGCPAMWDGEQRRRLLDIAAAVGLPVVGSALVDEPVAAGIAWLTYRYLRHGERPRGRLLVFDMGGGTLDVAVLDVAGGPAPEVAVLACVGVSVGGDVFDVAVAHDLAAEMAAHHVDIALHPEPELAWALLERAAREAKVRLSAADEHAVVLPRPLGYPWPLRYPRERLEKAFDPQFAGVENVVVAALRAAWIARTPATAADARAVERRSLFADVDYVLLAGGMSRVPYVARRLAALFPTATVHRHAGVPPEETIVAGLADPTGYERVTLDRPAVDIVLEWDDGRQRRTLYEAHTPLYEPWQVYNGHSDLGYERWLLPGDVPSQGVGRMRLLAPSGDPLKLELDGAPVDGLAVPFGPGDVVLRVTADRRLSVTDGCGGLTSLRTDGWPAGTDRAVSLHRLPAD